MCRKVFSYLRAYCAMLLLVFALSGCAERPYQRVPMALGLADASCEVNASQVEITQGEHRFVFHQGQRLAVLNGVNYYLHAPAGSDGLQSLDCQLIRYGVVERGNRNEKLSILLDAGHGGKDPGCMASSANEQSITLAIAKAVKGFLEEKGHTVTMTREQLTTTLTLAERTALAQSRTFDAFVSVHVNASANPETKGVEVFTIPAPGCDGTPANSPARAPMSGQVHLITATRLAMEVQRALLAQPFKPVDRGVKHAHFKVLRDIKAPGILVEVGFLTNTEDFKHLTSAEDQKVMARAIVTGIERALMP